MDNPIIAVLGIITAECTHLLLLSEEVECKDFVESLVLCMVVFSAASLVRW
jgi:hypothetical protein